MTAHLENHMHIAFCTPFKPLTHPRPSGDVTIARDLHDFFTDTDHTVSTPPFLGTEWIWKRPAMWPEAYRTLRYLTIPRQQTDIWFTYHSYYRAPDLLGPYMKKKHNIPYVIFAPSHSPKRFRHPGTLPGALLNKRALFAADHLFVNKVRDTLHLPDSIPKNRVSFIRPGIRTHRFKYDSHARELLRKEWQAAATPVVLSVASLRAGVKAQGIEHVIHSCAALRAAGTDLQLVIAGDGPEAARLKTLAHAALGDAVRFLGFVDRWSLYRIYSAADVFAFPGIREGLGMVYLEAQSCSLPVVAWDHDGAPEVVKHEKTGFITPSWDNGAFSNAIHTLLVSPALRKRMGEAAAAYVHQQHDLATNYAGMEKTMEALIRQHKSM